MRFGFGHEKSVAMSCYCMLSEMVARIVLPWNHVNQLCQLAWKPIVEVKRVFEGWRLNLYVGNFRRHQHYKRRKSSMPDHHHHTHHRRQNEFSPDGRMSVQPEDVVLKVGHFTPKHKSAIIIKFHSIRSKFKGISHENWSKRWGIFLEFTWNTLVVAVVIIAHCQFNDCEGLIFNIGAKCITVKSTESNHVTPRDKYFTWSHTWIANPMNARDLSAEQWIKRWLFLFLFKFVSYL